MKKLIIIWALLTSTVYAQSKAGFFVVGGKVITVQDTSSRNYLKAIENAGVVPSVLQNAASNFLVTSEKAIGSYSLITAQYPIMGGTAATHIFNLNKPTGLASDYTLQFFGTVTHNASGIKGDGSTGYADTKLKLSSNISSTGLVSFGFHTSSATTFGQRYDIGAGTDAGTSSYSFISTGNSTQYFASPFTTANSQLIVTTPLKKGFYQTTQNGTIKGYINGVLQTGTINYAPNYITDVNYSIMALNSNAVVGVGTSISQNTDKTYGYFFFASPFTDIQSERQSRIVTFFNSMQNR